MTLRLCTILLGWGIAAAQVTVDRDVVYARYGGAELRLDLYRPDPRPAGQLAGIIAIRGGGWRAGDKNGFASALVEHGFAVACIEYRVLPAWKFPAAAHDAKAAVRWMRSEGKRYGINPNAIGAIGGSAGGHLAALLGTSHKVAELEGAGGHEGVSSRVQAVVAMAPITDLRSFAAGRNGEFEFLGATTGEKPEVWRLATPATHVDRDSAPFLLLHSKADRTVPYSQSTEMQKHLKAAGVRGDMFLLEEAGHAFWNDPHYAVDTMDRAAAFFHSVLDAIRP